MLGVYRVCALKIGDGRRHADHAVRGTRPQHQPVGGTAQEGPGNRIESQPGVGPFGTERAPSDGADPRRGPPPSRDDPSPHGI
jgi:hypothetical protein